MDQSIPGITRGAQAPSAASPRAPAAGLAEDTRSPGVAPPRFGFSEAPAAAPAPPASLSSPTSSQVRPDGFGRDGRFEKFILALQALTLDPPAAASRTDRVERMRAAAEELFGIDGLPQPIRPMAGPAAPSEFRAEPAERLEQAPADASAPGPTEPPGAARTEAAPAGPPADAAGAEIPAAPAPSLRPGAAEAIAPSREA